MTSDERATEVSTMDQCAKQICSDDGGCRCDGPSSGDHPQEEFNVQLLPTEVWIVIFKQLRLRELMQVRQTCRTWRNVVENSAALMEMFGEITFSINLHYIERIFATSSARYTKARLTNMYIHRPDLFSQFHEFWVRFGESLHTLTIYCCSISFEGLLSMLKVTSNLQRLSISFTKRSYHRCMVDFRMENLGYLELYNVDSSEILDTFSEISPRLKSLTIDGGTYSSPSSVECNNYERSIINFVETVHKTLQQIELQYSRSMFHAITEIDQLQLSHVTLINPFPGLGINTFDESDVAFIQKTPSINYLDITQFRIATQTLVQIGASLPNLRCLNVSPPAEQMQFLLGMPQLESLGVCFAQGRCFAFNEFSTNIQDITLKLLRMPKPFTQQQFPNLYSVTLKKVIVNRTSDIVQLVTQLKTLQSLFLREIEIEFHDIDATFPLGQQQQDNVSNLRTIEAMNSTKWLNELLVALVRVCPAIQRIGWDIGYDQMFEYFREICSNLKCLKMLSISTSNISEDSLHYLVANRGANLRRLEITIRRGSYRSLSREKAEAILNNLKGVEVFYYKYA